MNLSDYRDGMSLEGLKSCLPANFEALNFDERRDLVSERIGAPVAEKATSYPSGGGSRYACWFLDGDLIVLERGGYDPITETTYRRSPYRGRALLDTEIASGRLRTAW